MKRILSLTLSLLALSGLLGSIPLTSAVWAEETKIPTPAATAVTKQTPLVSTDGHFKALLPAGFPDPQKEVVPMAKDRNYSSVRYSSSPTDDSSIVINVSEYTELNAGKPEDLLKKVLDANMEVLKANTDTQKVSTVNGITFQTVQFSPKASDSFYGRVDHYLDVKKKRLFQIIYLTRSEADSKSAKITDFFKSFKPQS